MNRGEPANEISTQPDPTAGRDEVELLERIEHTRRELGETVEQLATKADVKAQARATAAKLSARLKSTTEQLGEKAAAWGTADSTRQLVLPAIVTLTAIASAWLLLARRKRR
jgi:uncharacterized protein DUF3618